MKVEIHKKRLVRFVKVEAPFGILTRRAQERQQGMPGNWSHAERKWCTKGAMQMTHQLTFVF